MLKHSAVNKSISQPQWHGAPPSHFIWWKAKSKMRMLMFSLFRLQLVTEIAWLLRHRRQTEANSQSDSDSQHNRAGFCFFSTPLQWAERTNSRCTESALLLLLPSLFLQVLVVLVVRVQELVPPGEGGGVVPHKVHVVEVMETGAGIERDEVERVQRDVVAAVMRHDRGDEGQSRLERERAEESWSIKTGRGNLVVTRQTAVVCFLLVS